MRIRLEEKKLLGHVVGRGVEKLVQIQIELGLFVGCVNHSLLGKRITKDRAETLHSPAEHIVSGFENHVPKHPRDPRIVEGGHVVRRKVPPLAAGFVCDEPSVYGGSTCVPNTSEGRGRNLWIVSYTTRQRARSCRSVAWRTPLTNARTMFSFSAKSSITIRVPRPAR